MPADEDVTETLIVFDLLLLPHESGDLVQERSVRAGPDDAGKTATGRF